MFDLITGNVRHAPRPRATPVIVSIAAHAALVGGVLLGTLAFVTAPVPELPMMMAFVAPPPPPPPPPAPPPRTAEKRDAPKPVPATGEVAPIEPPSAIEAEFGADEEEVSGVEGGVPGGIMGGVVGGLIPDMPLPPPPPPQPAPPRGPVRIGGQLKEPTLIHRVEPEYPLLALARELEGVVILEAIVDEDGRVESVKVLRSPGVFEQAALAAVRQWRYSPVLLNGRPEKFVLTVVVSFRLDR
jgi:protein TonB